MADLTPTMQMWKLRLTKVKPLATINKQRWAWKTVAPPQSQHLKLWPMAHEARHHRLLGSPPTGLLAPSGPATWPLHCSSHPGHALIQGLCSGSWAPNSLLTDLHIGASLSLSLSLSPPKSMHECPSSSHLQRPPCFIFPLCIHHVTLCVWVSLRCLLLRECQLLQGSRA